MTCASGAHLLCQRARAGALRARQLQRRMRPGKGEVISRCKVPAAESVWPSTAGARGATFAIGLEPPSERPPLRKMMCEDALSLFFNLGPLPFNDLRLLCWNVQNGAEPHPTTQTEMDEGTPFTLLLAEVDHDQSQEP